jgi:AcrR family transcriptional regulator
MTYITAEARRQAFVKAAVKVLIKEGAARITTRRVAAAAKAPLASFHYAFERKEDLLRAVIEHYLDLLDEQCAANFKPERGLKAGVRALLQLIMDFCRKEPEFHLAQYELFLWALRTPSAHELAKYWYERWFERIEERLADCVTRGQPSTQELSRLARSFLIVADGMVLQIIALKDFGPQSRDLKRLTDAVMSSVAPDAR